MYIDHLPKGINYLPKTVLNLHKIKVLKVNEKFIIELKIYDLNIMLRFNLRG